MSWLVGEPEVLLLLHVLNDCGSPHLVCRMLMLLIAQVGSHPGATSAANHASTTAGAPATAPATAPASTSAPASTPATATASTTAPFPVVVSAPASSSPVTAVQAVGKVTSGSGKHREAGGGSEVKAGGPCGSGSGSGSGSATRALWRCASVGLLRARMSALQACVWR